MPHVVYLHSAMTGGRVTVRNDADGRRLLGFKRVDVGIAMGIAGLVNLSMLAAAAGLFYNSGLTGVDTIEGAHAAFGDLLGPGAALAFALALLVSGFASASVGTYAGQVVMQGFIARTIPLLVRRLVTMTLALIVLAIGVDPSRALVLSQVVLSFGIPFALIPLVDGPQPALRPAAGGRQRCLRGHRVLGRPPAPHRSTSSCASAVRARSRPSMRSSTSTPTSRPASWASRSPRWASGRSASRPSTT